MCHKTTNKRMASMIKNDFDLNKTLLFDKDIIETLM